MGVLFSGRGDVVTAGGAAAKDEQGTVCPSAIGWGWNGNGGWWLDYLRCALREVIRKLLSVIEGRVIQAKI